MIARQLAALPVEAFVHVENREVAQADLLVVHDFGKGLVPAARTARNDRARGQVLCVVACDEIREFAGHQGTHRRRVSRNSEGNLAVGVVFQLGRRNDAPVVELSCRDGVHFWVGEFQALVAVMPLGSLSFASY